MKADICRIWRTRAIGRHIFESGCDVVDSARAGGSYTINQAIRDDYFENPNRLDEQTKARLTSWLIEQRRFGIERPEITADAIQTAKLRRRLGVDERAYKLLDYLEQETSFVGEEIAFDGDGEDNTFLEMLAWLESTQSDEIEYLLQFLEQCGFSKTEHFDDVIGSTKVLVDGHVHLAKLTCDLYVPRCND